MNHLARPVRLLVLIGIVALLVGFGGTGTAWSDPPPFGTAGYKFLNGETWGEPGIGYLCRGIIKNRQTIENPNKIEVLRVYGQPGDTVLVDLRGTSDEEEEGTTPVDPEVMKLKYAYERRQFITMPAPDNFVDFRITSTKDGDVDRQFYVHGTDLLGRPLTPYYTDGGVSFRVQAKKEEDPANLAATTADSSEDMERHQDTGGLQHRMWIDPSLFSSRLDGKPAPGRMHSVVSIKFDALQTRRSLDPSSSTIGASGDVRSDILGIETGRIYPPGDPDELRERTRSIVDDVRLAVSALPHLRRSGFEPWVWQKNRRVGLRIGEDNKRFVTLSWTVSSKVDAGDTKTTTRGVPEWRGVSLDALNPF